MSAPERPVYPRAAGKIISVMTGLFLIVCMMIGLAFYRFGHSFCSSSSNAVIYFVRDDKGSITITPDLSIEQADSLIFDLDMNCLFSWFFHRVAMAAKKTVLDVTWDSDTGRGNIKQFRPDGTMFAVTFSRGADRCRLPSIFQMVSINAVLRRSRWTVPSIVL